MYETLKAFKPMYQKTTIKDLKEAVERFKRGEVAEAIGFIYCNQYGHLKNISAKFPRLTAEDKASFILSEINSALTDYDKTKGAQIQTLVSKYAYRRLYSENKMREHQKRRANYDQTTASYEEYIETAAASWGSNDEYRAELLDYLKSIDLTENELEFCKIIITNRAAKNTDIAKIMGVTPAAVTYIKNKLKLKVSPLII